MPVETAGASGSHRGTAGRLRPAGEGSNGKALEVSTIGAAPRHDPHPVTEQAGLRCPHPVAVAPAALADQLGCEPGSRRSSSACPSPCDSRWLIHRKVYPRNSALRTGPVQVWDHIIATAGDRTQHVAGPGQHRRRTHRRLKPRRRTQAPAQGDPRGGCPRSPRGCRGREGDRRSSEEEPAIFTDRRRHGVGLDLDVLYSAVRAQPQRGAARRRDARMRIEIESLYTCQVPAEDAGDDLEHRRVIDHLPDGGAFSARECRTGAPTIGSDVARPLLCPMESARSAARQPRQQLAVDHGFEQHHAVAFERRHRMRAGECRGLRAERHAASRRSTGGPAAQRPALRPDRRAAVERTSTSCPPTGWGSAARRSRNWRSSPSSGRAP